MQNSYLQLIKKNQKQGVLEDKGQKKPSLYNYAENLN